ncbi:MAG TPA: hypothetical protein VMF69_25320 [Gemmataceae bacterium]|nr:hypothetical protein [Gemmataceae bacterium]
MTLFGKLLVLLNLALAMVLAAWSFNIYANGVDWTDRKDTKSTPPRMGQFAVRAAKLDELWKGVPPVQTDWLRERDQLAREEKRLADERVWYDKEIRYVLDGPAKGKGIREVDIASKDDPNTGAKKGQILLDNQGYPQLVPIRDPNGAPLQLQSLVEYNRENEGLLKEISDQIEQHEKQIKEANALTDRITGDKTKGIRGLQQRINDEQAKNDEVIAEIKLVEPQLINTLVEAQLVNKRHAQMTKRIEELKKIKVASK